MTDQVDANGVEARAVGAALGIGILLLPFVFAWFTLRNGYSKLARGMSLGWMAIVLLMGIGASHSSVDPQPASGDESAETTNDALASSSNTTPDELPQRTSQSLDNNNATSTESGLTMENAQKLWDCGHWYLIAATKLGYNNPDKVNEMLQSQKVSFSASQYITRKFGMTDDTAKSQLNSASNPFNNYSIGKPGWSDEDTMLSEIKKCNDFVSQVSQNSQFPGLRAALLYGINQSEN